MTVIRTMTKKKPPQYGRAYRAPWYDTQRWRVERIEYITENPECELCKQEGRRGIPSTILDHIKNIASLPEDKREQMFWDRSNWQAICTRHHNQKSGKERR